MYPDTFEFKEEKCDFEDLILPLSEDFDPLELVEPLKLLEPLESVIKSETDFSVKEQSLEKYSIQLECSQSALNLFSKSKNFFCTICNLQFDKDTVFDIPLSIFHGKKTKIEEDLTLKNSSQAHSTNLVLETPIKSVLHVIKPFVHVGN